MKKDKQKPARIAYIDVLNIVAIFSVIILHHNGLVHVFSRDSYWTQSLVPETVFYFAVPLFLMITGATLLNYRKKYDTKTFFRKRFIKILIPSIAWMLIMFLWHVIRKDIDVSNLSPVSFINIFTTNQENTIYYYLFVIIGIYLTIPLFAPLAEDQKYRKILWYGVGVWFVFNTLLPDLLSLAGVHWNGDVGLRIGSYVVYLFLGHLLSTTDIKKKYRILLYFGGGLSILYRYLTTYFMSMEAGTVVNTTWGYSSFHTMILASAVFVFIKNLPLDKVSDRVKKILSKLAGCSFGIYLSHILIMHYELRFFTENFGMSEFSKVWRFLAPLLTYVICVGLVLVLKKIPFVKKIVP